MPSVYSAPFLPSVMTAAPTPISASFAPAATALSMSVIFTPVRNPASVSFGVSKSTPS